MTLATQGGSSGAQAIAPSVARLEGVSLRYGKTMALDGVALDIPGGRMVGLVGPDGVGKSSLLALVAGARIVQQGTVEVLGGDMRSRHHRNRVCPAIAYMPQGLGKNLYPALSVEDNLQFFGRLFGHDTAERRRRIDELTQATGLYAFLSRPAGKLSGGMKQKLGLCCALIHDPDLLILDEPTTGVDPLTRQEFWQLILRLTGEGQAAILVSTPYMDEATRCTRIGFMRGGQLAAEGTPRELRGRLEGRVLEVTGAPLAALLPALSALNGVLSVQRFGERLHLTVAPGQTRQVQHALGPAARQAGARLAQVEIVPALLEDVFIAMSGEAAQ